MGWASHALSCNFMSSEYYRFFLPDVSKRVCNYKLTSLRHASMAYVNQFAFRKSLLSDHSLLVRNSGMQISYTLKKGAHCSRL